MCYNRTVSISNFFINVLTSASLFFFSRGDATSNKICALFFLFVGLMQAYDWYFWDHNEKSLGNHVVTKIAMVTNHLQPVVLGGLIYLYEGYLPMVSIVTLGVYVFVGFVYSAIIWNRIDYTVTGEVQEPVIEDLETSATTPLLPNATAPSPTSITFFGSGEPKPNLLFWQWNYQKHSGAVYALFLLTFSVLMYENFPSPLNYFLVAINLGSFVAAELKHNYVGERWCEFACYVPLFILAFDLGRR